MYQLLKFHVNGEHLRPEVIIIINTSSFIACLIGNPLFVQAGSLASVRVIPVIRQVPSSPRRVGYT